MEITKEDAKEMSALFLQLVDATYGIFYYNIGVIDGINRETAERMKFFARKYSKDYFQNQSIDIVG